MDVMETYSIALKMPYKGEQSEQSTFKVFLGPLQHSELKSYGKGLENIMSLGWAWLVRPISEYVMLPSFYCEFIMLFQIGELLSSSSQFLSR